jgi:hypothetical protein
MEINQLTLLFPEKVERHEKSKPPKEAYFFMPSEDEKIIFNNNDPKSTRRKIFGIKEEYSDFEKSKLKLLKEEIQNLISRENEDLIPLKELKDEELLRYHQSTSYRLEKTMELLRENLVWKKGKIFPLNLNENVKKILNSGFIYVHGRDSYFRPIIVVSAQTYLNFKNNFEFEDIVTAVIYFIEYIINYMLIPGQVENWDIIADLNKVSLFGIPDTLRKIFKILQSNYRARLNVVYILGKNPWFNALWTIVKAILDSNTNKKFTFIDENSKYQMFEFINNEQVEQKYGGLARNVDCENDGYFPPIIPSENFLKQSNLREEILISEEMYIELYNQGRISQLSPYMVEKINKRGSFLSQTRLEGKNFILKFYFITLVESNYEDAMSHLDFKNSPIPKKSRQSIDGQSTKSMSVMNYVNVVHSLGKKNFQSLSNQDHSYIKNFRKSSTLKNKKINCNNTSKATMNSASFYEICSGDNLSNFSKEPGISGLSAKSGNGNNFGENLGKEIMVECIGNKIENDIKIRNFNSIKSASIKKIDREVENMNGTTKETKQEKLDSNKFNSIIFNSNSNEIYNSSKIFK